MRILHTSDWHLGRAFGPVSLHDHQAQFMDWLVTTAHAERVDLVIVAGDVFDRAIAPTESMVLFRDTLRRLVGFTKVAVITGNHDGADRVNTYGDLLDLSGVLLRGGYDGAGEVITLEMSDGPVDVVLLPFLDPQAAPVDVEHHESAHHSDAPSDVESDAAFAAKLRRTHHSVLAAAVARAAAQIRSPRSIAVAHAFVAGGEASESERELSVGGTSLVDLAVFAPFSYTALGHLHRPQSLSPTVRYSGTPLAYSFGEKHAKSVTIVDLATDGAVVSSEIPVPVGRRVLTVTGTMEQLLAAAPGEADREAFVRAIVTDTGAVLDAKDRLSAVYPHVVEIILQPVLSLAAGGPISSHELPVLRPTEVADRFWESVVGTEPDDDERSLLHEAVIAAVAVVEGRVG